MGGRRGILVVVALLSVAVAVLRLSPETRFLLGGVALNVGYRLQDDVHDVDSSHEDDVRPEEVWADFLRQNALASGVRARFPRSTYHPRMALLVCMDARIDTNELVGDTRRNYYIVRTAGSALSPKEEDMLELAVNNGVKVILLTRHTDCAAEKIEADPAQRPRYPALVASLDERDARVREFLARPAIAERIADGRLLVKQLVIDTASEHLLAAMPAASGAAAVPEH